VGDPTAPGFAPGQAEQITFAVESVNTSDGGGNGEIQTSAAPGAESGKSGLPLMLLIAAVLFGS
jgi:prepilin signal peptidase PulO-like enzyme (type II secretory pathway)